MDFEKNNFTLEELVARSELCGELLSVITECESKNLSVAETLGTLEGQIEIIRTFCEIKINKMLTKMEIENGL